VLLLDEPTNHLDMEAIRALAKAVKDFEGTTIFVSHNRWFVSELATRIVEIREDGVVDFPGTFDEYLAKCGDDHLDASAVLAKKKAETQAAAAASGGKTDLGWEEAKRKRNRLKVLKDKNDKLQASIDAQEQRLSAIKQSYCEEGFFERTSAAQVDKLHAEEKDLGEKIEALMAEWESIETELGELKAALGEA
jgi:ABC-type multidrug transport system ATPase subunit